MSALPAPARANSRARTLLKFLAPAGVLDLYRRQRYGLAPAPAPAIPFALPATTLEALFPTSERLTLEIPAAQVRRPADMVLPLADLLTLATICKALQPAHIFEIGTYSGSTTLLMALNTAAAHINTLDLSPLLFDGSATGAAFAGTAPAARITQLFGDSTTFDFSPYYGSADLVFVDANHTYEFVKSDSATAFRLLRPGGVIVWDDYRWEPRHAECAGVTRHLNELAATRPLFQISGARLAIYPDWGPR